MGQGIGQIDAMIREEKRLTAVESQTEAWAEGLSAGIEPEIIAEALIATAIGLAAAIPAVMAYNHFIRRIRVLEAETEAFASDYLNIVRRHYL